MTTRDIPSGAVSANNLKYCLAGTSGIPSSISLNDYRVRQAAGQQSGSVSMSNMRGKRIIYSATLTVGYTAFLSPVGGWAKGIGGGISENSTSGDKAGVWQTSGNYYAQPFLADGVTSPQMANLYVQYMGDSGAPGAYRNWYAGVGFGKNMNVLPTAVDTIYLRINGTTYTVSNSVSGYSPSQRSWAIGGGTNNWYPSSSPWPELSNAAKSSTVEILVWY